MTEAQRDQIRSYLEELHIPRYRELPDFGLRLEQVVRFAGRYSPTPITGSMVSNYVKQRLIPPPVRKDYPRESLAYLIFLITIKTVLTMEDARLLMELQRKTYSLETAYDYFCEEYENLLWYVCGLKEAPAPVGVTHSETKELLRTALLAAAQQVYLDQCMKQTRLAAAGENELPDEFYPA